MKTLAIIPARGGSKRVPKKNVRELCGKPLILWTVEFAQSIPWFDRIHVSTDCRDIAAVCESAGLVVPFLRAESTSSDTAATADVVREVIETLETLGESYDLVAILQPTTPWRKRERWEEALNALSATELDSAVGAGRAAQHPFHMFTTSAGGLVEYYFPPSLKNLRSQEQPPAYYINGSLYLSKVDKFLSENSLLAGRCVPIICSDSYENIDIDTEADLDAARSSCPEHNSL